MKRLILVLVLCWPMSLLADFQAGVDAAKRGDYATAHREFWPLAAVLGVAKAQNNLGVMYQYGKGMPQDYAEAVKWYRRAAEQGNAKAQYNLGFIYRNGRGVSRDYAEAVKWYHHAAEQGNAKAQYNLGIMYAKGQGLPQDYVRAYAWFNVAATQGNEQAVNNRDVIQRKMTLAHVTEGQKLSRELFERLKK